MTARPERGSRGERGGRTGGPRRRRREVPAGHWLAQGAGSALSANRQPSYPVSVASRAARAPEAEVAARSGSAMAREKQQEAAAEAEGTPERSYREQLDFLNPIAQPLASRKLTRKLYKCIRKGLAGAGTGTGAWQRPGHGKGRPGPGLGGAAPSRCASLAAAKHKQIRRGVKEVQKFINKGEKG